MKQRLILLILAIIELSLKCAFAADLPVIVRRSDGFNTADLENQVFVDDGLTTFTINPALAANALSFTDAAGDSATLTEISATTGTFQDVITTNLTVLGTPPWSGADFDTEAELEGILTDVSDVFTNNDGALADDDLSDDSIEALLDVDSSMTPSTGQVLEWNGSIWTAGTDDSGGGGSGFFLDHSDTPSTYSTHSGKLVRVNTGETALEFIDLSSIETDPVYSADPAFGITSGDIANWDAAFGWGDHSSAGYLLETDADTEAELEALLTDVSNVFTNNDGALNDDDVTLADVQAATSNDFHNIGGVDDDVPDAGDLGIIDTEAEFESELFAIFTPSDGALDDDDLSDNSIEDLSDVATMTPSSGEVLKWNGSAWAAGTDETGGSASPTLEDIATNSSTAGDHTYRLTDNIDVIFEDNSGSNILRIDESTLQVDAPLSGFNSRYYTSDSVMDFISDSDNFSWYENTGSSRIMQLADVGSSLLELGRNDAQKGIIRLYGATSNGFGGELSLYSDTTNDDTFSDIFHISAEDEALTFDVQQGGTRREIFRADSVGHDRVTFNQLASFSPIDRTGLGSPQEGDALYDSTDNVLMFYNGSAWIPTSGTSDHGALSGLGDDDHPQYGALAQNETVTGTWTFTQNPRIANRLIHDGDLDTYIEFLDNRFIGVTGNTTWFDAADTYIILNSSQADKNIFFRSQADANSLFIDGGTGNVGIKKTGPTAALDINGDAHVENDLTVRDQLVMSNTSGNDWYWEVDEANGNLTLSVPVVGDYFEFVSDGSVNWTPSATSGRDDYLTITDGSGGQIIIGVDNSGAGEGFIGTGNDENFQILRNGSIAANFSSGGVQFAGTIGNISDTTNELQTNTLWVGPMTSGNPISGYVKIGVSGGDVIARNSAGTEVTIANF